MKKDFFIRNRENLSKKMENNSILVMFAGEAPYKSADEIYAFTPNRNFYYLTGIDKPKMILMLIKNKDEVKQTLFIEKNDPVMARWVGEKMSDTEAKEVSGIEDIKYIEEFEDNFGTSLNRIDINNLYLDLERQEFDIPCTKSQSFAQKVLTRYAYIRVRNIYNDICELRVIKSQEEIELMKKAIDITDKGIQALMINVKPEMMEYELEAYFDFTLKTNGINDYAFHTIAAAGKNATILHYVENNSKIGANDLILFDLGAQYKYYNADISRTLPANGKFTERQKQVYNVVLKANEEVIKAVKPGMPFSKLNEICKTILTEGCRELGLIKEDSELSNYYFHGVSHYLGADTHDVGSRDIELKPGMVFTVEPGLYIEEECIGIRIEDDIVVTEDGYENLSKQIIKTVEDIENFMNK